MTAIKVKIDNRIAFKGTLEEWVRRAPDEFKNAIVPNAKPQPWMKAILIAMADAVVTSTPSNITVRTRLQGVKRGWSMEVVEP